MSYIARTSRRPHSGSTVRLLTSEMFDGMYTRNATGTSLSHPPLGTGPSIHHYWDFVALFLHMYSEFGNERHDDVAVEVISSQSDVATLCHAHTA